MELAQAYRLSPPSFQVYAAQRLPVSLSQQLIWFPGQDWQCWFPHVTDPVDPPLPPLPPVAPPPSGGGLPLPVSQPAGYQESDYELLFTPQMAGDITLEGRTIPLAQLAQGGGAHPSSTVSGAYAYALPIGARATSISVPRRLNESFIIWYCALVTGSIGRPSRR